MRINVKLAITIVVQSDVSINAKASHARELLQQVKLKIGNFFLISATKIQPQKFL